MNNSMGLWRNHRTSPLRDLSQLQRTFDSLFEDVLFGERRPSSGTDGFQPNVDLKETKDNYLMRFDLPGLSKEDIKIELHDKQLTVSGERKFEKAAEGETEHFSEIAYGSFARRFTFPTGVDAEKIEAKFDNGVLTVKIPKAEASRARQISVQ